VVEALDQVDQEEGVAHADESRYDNVLFHR
jgi:hypothetical protein